MKGLLIKDICQMSQQLKLIGLVLLLAAFLNYTGDDAFAVYYLLFFSSFFVLSSITYDEYENGFYFLFTLPIKRNTYVRSKYVLAFICCLSSWLMGCLISLFCYLAKNQADQMWGGIGEASMFLPLMLIFIAVMIPLVLKLGTEKGRIVMAVLYLGCGFLVYLIVSKTPVGIKILDVLSWLDKQSPWILAGGAAAGTVIILVISYGISLVVMRRKEF